MRTLDELQARLAAGQFDFSHHAFKRAVTRNISDEEIMHAGTAAVIIEDYPEDKYSPSCLLLGFTSAGRPLHLQVSRAESEWVRVITLYEPDETEWSEGFTKRR